MLRFAVPFVFVICFELSAKETTNENLINRIETLESKLNSNAFSYDINLRAKVAESLSQQKLFLVQLERYEERLLFIEKEFFSISKKCCEKKSSKEFEEELKRLEKDYKELYRISEEANKNSLNAITTSNSNTVESIKTSLSTTSNIIYWVLGIFSALLTFASVAATIYGIYSNKKLNNISRTSEGAKSISTEAVENANKIKELYNSIKEEIAQNIDGMTLMHTDITLIHQYMDFKENYARLVEHNFDTKFEAERLVVDGKKLLTSLQDYYKQHESDETLANISYVASLIGVTLHCTTQYEEALEYFELSIETNIKKRADRLYNLVCCASQLFRKSNCQDLRYLNMVVSGFEQLAENQRLIEKLKGDSDLEETIDHVTQRLG